MPLEALVREEPKLTFLTVQRRPVINHLRVDLHFVYPLHVVAQLFQVFDVAIAYLANDEGRL